MADTDQFINKSAEPNSTLFGVSIRAWITLVLVTTVCVSFLSVVIGSVVNAVMSKDWSLVGTLTSVGEPLYSLSTLAVGFYFGQKVTEKK